MRLLQVPYTLHPCPTRLRPPGTGLPPGIHHQAIPIRRRDPLPPPVLHHRVLPPGHRRRSQQQAQPRHLPRSPNRLRTLVYRRLLAWIRHVPLPPAGVVGGAQRLELQRRVEAGGSWGVADKEGSREGEPDGGQGTAVAPDPVLPRAVQAVRGALSVRAGRGGTGGGGAGACTVRTRAQPGQGARRVRGGGDGGVEPRTAEVRDPALEEALVRGGPVVREAARRRV
ncbi:hypothetical protein Dimus_017241 [Dionaea muscipula]